MVTGATWGFYGRGAELEQLRSILGRGRWFFARVSGRRRIGKTALIQQALRSVGSAPVLYDTPTSSPSGSGHVARFLSEHPRFDETWTVEKVAISPVIDAKTRAEIEARGFIVQDLRDLTAGL